MAGNRVINKKQLMEELGISSLQALKRIVTRAGIIWEKGQQLFTPAEQHKIFVHYDHQPDERI